MNTIIRRSIMLCCLTICFEVASFGQDEGIPTGAFQFEKERNQLFARYLLEEEKAIRLLENELAYRKIRREMFQLGAKRNGIVAKEPPLSHDQEMSIKSIDLGYLRWRHYLGNDVTRYIEDLGSKAIDLNQSKIELLLAQIDRLQFDRKLLEKQVEYQTTAARKLPVDEETFLKRQVNPLKERLRAIDEEIADRKIEIDKLLERAIDLGIENEMNIPIEREKQGKN
jgi:hypothetical protein